MDEVKWIKLTGKLEELISDRLVDKGVKSIDAFNMATKSSLLAMVILKYVRKTNSIFLMVPIRGGQLTQGLPCTWLPEAVQSLSFLSSYTLERKKRKGKGKRGKKRTCKFGQYCAVSVGQRRISLFSESSSFHLPIISHHFPVNRNI